MRAEDLEALREDMLAVITAGAFALRDTIGKNAFDERVMTAMGKVPRHEFVPIELQPYAYANIPLPVGFEQTNLAAIYRRLNDRSARHQAPRQRSRNRYRSWLSRRHPRAARPQGSLR